MSYTQHIQPHARSKPTFTIACTVIMVIMYEIPNCTLQVLNPIKTNNRNRIFNRRAMLRYLTLLFKLLPTVSLSNLQYLQSCVHEHSWFFQQMRCSSQYHSSLSNWLAQFCRYFRSLKSHICSLMRACMNFTQLAHFQAIEFRDQPILKMLNIILYVRWAYKTGIFAIVVLTKHSIL